jgi:hypothetical protein
MCARVYDIMSYLCYSSECVDIVIFRVYPVVLRTLTIRFRLVLNRLLRKGRMKMRGRTETHNADMLNGYWTSYLHLF